MSSIFPVGLRLDRLPVLVVGGGRVAERRVTGLLAAGALVTVVSPEISAQLARLHEAAALTWLAREYRPSDLDGCWLVQAATNDPAVNDLIATHAHAAQIFCLKGGDPHGATAWRPAVVQVDEVTVAISASGNPHRAKRIRDAVANFLTEINLD